MDPYFFSSYSIIPQDVYVHTDLHNEVPTPSNPYMDYQITFLQTHLDKFKTESDANVNFSKFTKLGSQSESTLVNKIVRVFMSFTGLDNFDYQVQKYEPLSCFQNVESSNEYFVSFVVLLHRQNKLYGKIIHVELLFNEADETDTKLLFVKVLGNIAEDNMKMSGVTDATPFDQYASYKPF